MTTPFSLGYFSFFGPPSWQASDDRLNGGDWWTGEHHLKTAQRLEAAHFDYIFYEDTLGIPRDADGSMNSALKYGISAPSHDPLTLIPLLAHGTSDIGLIVTASTSFYSPFMLARLFSTLDSMSNGRVGWNIVTSAEKNAAQNFGLEDMPPHDERYDNADEFVEVTKKLWNAWGEGSLVRDVETNTYVDSSKVSSVDHVGERFSVKGPLNTLRSPQVTPLLVQAGASDRGKTFAASHAELIFSPILESAEAMKALRDDIRQRAKDQGRNPDDIKVVFASVLRFFDEEWDLSQGFPLTDDQEEGMIAWASQTLDTDFAQFDLDVPLPLDTPSAGHTSMFDVVLMLSSFGMSLRDSLLALRYGVGDMSFFGTPEQIADKMEAFIDAVGGDGLMIIGAQEETEEYMDKLTNQLVPILKARGVVRESYDGKTLRGNLWPSA
ncbi:MAG TPA: NtaA/DmoA family FMN-dependent monooxygenase [Pseudolysinimonas sp.]|nr:NtaA/DmoA family FMN-dependent monooxygenase [Pseudolysinimonas sp.]